MRGKPLFIPLKGEFFDAFANGSKDEEYRVYGARWNERTCRVGRAVTLSKGYGTKHRLYGVVMGFRASKEPTQTPAWKACYGDTPNGAAACIKIGHLTAHKPTPTYTATPPERADFLAACGRVGEAMLKEGHA